MPASIRRLDRKNNDRRMASVVTEVLEGRVLLSSAYSLAAPAAGNLATISSLSVDNVSQVTTATSTTIAAPVAISPGNATSPGPVITTLTPTFSWQPLTASGTNTAITGYQINIGDSTAGKSFSYTVGASVSNYTIASGVLTAGDDFVWNVRGLDGNVSGSPSTYLYFQTQTATVLPTPRAISPGNATSPGPVLTTLTPTLNWTPVTTSGNTTIITGYQINIADTTAGKSYSYNVGASVGNYTIATGVLTAGDSFVWNVRCLNGNVSGSPSTYLYFQAPPATVLTAPTAISPGNATSPGPVVTTLTPTFTWSAVSGVTGYQINVYDSTLSKTSSYTVGASVTSYTIASGVLTAGDSFVWNVRGLNGNVSGPESNYLYFQTQATTVLPTPTAISPGNATSPGPVLTTLTPTLSWTLATPVGSTNSTITGYQINIADTTAGKSYSYTVGTSVGNYTIAAGVLTAGDSFVWNVRCLNGNVSGSPSTYLCFQTPPATVLPTPTAISPGNATSPGPVLTTLTPTFSWTPVTTSTNTTITGYQINIADTTAGKSYSYTVGASVGNYTIAAGVLTAGDSFVWNVRCLNGNVSGPPSTYLYFQTPAPTVLPTPVAISPGSTESPGPVLATLTPTLSWTPVTTSGNTTITGYQINVSDTKLGRSYTYTVGVSVSSYTIAAGVLTAGDSFVWNVRCLNGNIGGSPSAYLYFQTPAATVLPTPTAISPGNATSPGPMLTTLTPTLSWAPVTTSGNSTITGYQINLADTTAGKSYSYTVGASVGNYTIGSGVLTAGDSFVWNVRCLNGNVSGPPSTYLYFQAPPATVLPTPVAISPGNATSPGPVLTTLTPTFSWTLATPVGSTNTTITGYQINLADTTAGKSYSYTVGASVGNYTIGSGVLTAGDSFVWNVRCLNGNVSGPPSTYLYFQAPPATVLPTPVAISPGNATSPGPVLTTLTPTLSWGVSTAGAASTITGYQINIADTTAGKSYSYTVGASVGNYTIPAGVLTAGDSFVWNVRCLNGNASGSPSNYLYFQTPPATVTQAPTAISPGNATSPGPVITTIPPTFSWSALSNVTGYQINIYDDTLAKMCSYTVGASVTSYTIASGVLTAGDKFVWNVRGLNGNVSGPESNYLYFQVPVATVTPTPVAIAPGNTTSPGPVLTTLAPTFSWTPATAGTANTVTGYQISIYDSTLRQLYTYTVGASVSSYTIASGILTAGDSFVWNVRGLNGSASGLPSAYLYFQTPAATASAAAQNSVLSTPTPAFSTNPITGGILGQIDLDGTVID